MSGTRRIRSHFSGSRVTGGGTGTSAAPTAIFSITRTAKDGLPSVSARIGQTVQRGESSLSKVILQTEGRATVDAYRVPAISTKGTETLQRSRTTVLTPVRVTEQVRHTDVFTAIVKYLTAGAHTFVAQTTATKIELWGAGGNGGNSSVSGGGGGGTGAYARTNAFASTVGTSYPFFVGKDQAGGGENSTFNTSTTKAAGGSLGGTGSASAQGAGGAGGTTAASTGDVTTAGSAGGGAGGVGTLNGGGGGGSPGSTGAGGAGASGGAGGTAGSGGGAPGGTGSSGATAATAGTQPGSGGGGASSLASANVGGTGQAIFTFSI